MPPKLSCAFHNGEPLTNFCMDKKCLLPLCPTCVKIHSVEHQLMQTIPHYEEINQLTAVLGQHMQRDTATIDSDIGLVLNAQNALSCSKMRALQSVDIFRREMQAEIEMFCEGIQKSIVELFKQLEESLKKSNALLSKNGQATKMLLECLHGEKPMRAVIKYLGKLVREKVEKCHKEVEDMVKLPNNLLMGIEIKSDPVKSLREVLQSLVKVQTSRRNGRSLQVPLIDIYQQLNSDRRKECGDSATSKNSIATIEVMRDGATTPMMLTEQKTNKSAYKSLPHHQIPPQKSPAASIKSKIGMLLSSTHQQSQQYVVKTIENDRPHEFTATFHADRSTHCEISRQQSTPKSYHLLGTRRPTNRNEHLQTSNNLDRSLRQNSQQKRVRTGLMLIHPKPQQQTNKGRRISFQRNIKMYNKENLTTFVEPFNE